MPNILTLNFDDAPPAQGGGAVHVPPGEYVFKVGAVKIGTTKAGATMVNTEYVIAEGPHKGVKLYDRFPFPKTPADSKFGMQRMHAFLLALGARIPAGSFKFNFDSLTNKVVVCMVRDAKLDAIGSPNDADYKPERTVSSPSEYFNYQEWLSSQNGNVAAAMVAAGALPVAPAVTPVPPAVTAVAATATATTTADAAVTEAVEGADLTEADIDDMFPA